MTLNKSTRGGLMLRKKLVPKKPYDLTQIEQAMTDREWESWYSPVVQRGPTYSEAFLAYLFDSLELGYIREHVIGRYPIDFYFPDLKLLVDVDSPCYRGKGGKNSKKKRGDIKEEYLRCLGWEFFRFRWVRDPLTNNRDITEQTIDELLNTINILRGK